ncbi:MAG TPA: hypothetical protein HA319_06830 [Nitrosopumilaceae archaeon]|nr:hypothetical protein [Nitrosopumilaceae archaeon]
MQNRKTCEVCIIDGFESRRDYHLTDLKKETKACSEIMGLKLRVDNASKSSDFVEFNEQLVGDYQKMKKRQEKKSNLIDMNRDSIRNGSGLIGKNSKDSEEMKSMVANTQKIKERIVGLSLTSLETGIKRADIFRYELPLESSSLKFTSSNTQFSHFSIINEGAQ